MAKKSTRFEKFMQKRMHEWSAGEMHRSKGRKKGAKGSMVPKTKKGQKMALAIGYSEGRKKGFKGAFRGGKGFHTHMGPPSIGSLNVIGGPGRR